MVIAASPAAVQHYRHITLPTLENTIYKPGNMAIANALQLKAARRHANPFPL